MTRRGLGVCALMLALAAASGAHAQQTYPEKTVRVVSPFPPGGAADTLARALAQKMTESFGRSAVVENRVGAGGTIGTDVVAKAAPDGYTLLLGNVSTLASGPGSITHFTGELLNAAGKVNITHVPYKGAAPVIQAMISGEVDTGVLQVLEALPHHRAGRLRALAVSGTQRSTAIPEIPHAGELGLRGLESTTWYCVVAPRGVPQPVVKTLHATLTKAITSADFVKRFTAEGIMPETSTPEDLAKLVRSDIQRWAEVAKRTGVKLD